MISIIICSRREKINKIFFSNINNTIGCAYEIIPIDNSENKYSIFEAYNRGIAKSTGEILCFLHDDIIFYTENWGKKLAAIFEEFENVGLVGIAGGKVKSKMPSAWWDGGQNILKLIQHYKDGSKKMWDQGFNRSEEEVVAIDGVFMAMRRDKRINFNEKFTGFHNYDLNLSLEHHFLQKKILVTNQILLSHFSEGTLNKSWIESTSSFHKKYKKQLPIGYSPLLHSSEIDLIEFKIGVRFINKLLEQKLFKDAFYWWFHLIRIKPKSKYHIHFLKKIFNYL